MFATPAASRGKSKKALAERAETLRQLADASSCEPALGARAKRQLQRATRAQRRAGGLRRGGDYEVEELGGLYGRSGGVAVASDDEASSSGEGGPGEEAAEAASGSCPAAAAGGACVRQASEPGEEPEVREVQAELRSRLRAWAADSGMPEEEKRRCVRQLLAQWHPDKNQHIRTTATRVFQFIQAEVNQIISELGEAASEGARKEAEARQRKAQRMAEKSATASALRAARADKSQRKGALRVEVWPTAADLAGVDEGTADARHEEWALVIGHGPATTSHLRPWPRSHLSLLASPVEARDSELILFGGEAYDGRELTFYSDLYRVDLLNVEACRPLPWEKLYASVPAIAGPEARSSHQAVAWGKWLYVFGGEWSSRDQRRYRQYNDLWRFDTTAGPGARWQLLEAQGAPSPRSGHRMTAAAGCYAVLFGGFTEDRRRRAMYLADLHTLQLESCVWQQASTPGRRAACPSKRAGHLLWSVGGAVYVYGGTRPRKGGEDLEVLEDLWQARLDTSASTSAPCAVWEPLATQGQGPGARSGLCQCAVSPQNPSRRLVFGGVVDFRVPASCRPASKGAKEVSLFMNELFLLDCEAGRAAVWSRLWPAAGEGCPMPVPRLEPAALPPALLATGGGADALALMGTAGAAAGAAAPAPRGRIAGGCAVVRQALWIFGGSCESGPRQEVTLDDLWRLELRVDEDGQVRCGAAWECVLPLSERATVWFDSESDDDNDDDETEATGDPSTKGSLVAVNGCSGVLSRKQQKEETKRARMEFKREKQREKCEEKLDKRAAKRERQRAEAQAKAGAC
mmetsp:Transcript_24346/g.75761  ORF Transcript_24346/g.75761 Transcript_24346/m.75761 type:complete len:803 (+) Transcript_24346:76-2484(+)